MGINLLSSRRNFLFGASALSFAGCIGSRSLAGDKPNLKFGVVSDIHITDWVSGEIFRKTLRYFRDHDVDAVMIVGDMADHGLIIQLENVAKSWFEVFPNDKGLNGKHVERLFVYGNHDPDGLTYRDAAMDKAFAAHHLTYEEAAKLQLRVLGMDKGWEKCFHEEYKPIYHKVVKGYDFIGAHWDWQNGCGVIDKWMAANAKSIDTAKPFFYFQHPSPRHTVYAEDSWGDDNGASVRALSPYANAVAFSGHSHRPLTDGRSYWRGEFTSIGTSTLSYVCMPPRRIGAKNYRDNLDARCGQIVNVYDDRLEIERRDFFHDEDLDEPVVLPMPTKVSTFTARSTVINGLPQFKKGAKLKAELTAKAVNFEFPSAFDNPLARPFDYEVTISAKVPNKKRPWRKTVLYAQPEAVMSRKRAIAAGGVKGSFALGDLPKGYSTLSIAVTARNCYGGLGGHISTKNLMA